MSAQAPHSQLRRYHWVTRLEPVRKISPVLIDALGAAGIDAVELANRLGQRRLGVLRAFAYQELTRSQGTLHLVDPTGTLEDCVLRRSGDRLEARFAIGELASVRTIGDRCRLTVATIVPETIAAGAAGRRLGDIVDHPLLRDCDYRVRSVRVLERMGLTVIDFHAPRVTVDPFDHRTARHAS